MKKIKQIKTEYFLVPFMADETATIMQPLNNKEIIYANKDQEDVTIEQMHYITTTMESYKGVKAIPTEREALMTFIVEECCLYFSNAAIVHIDDMKRLRKEARRCMREFGGDSSTYQACEEYNELLVHLAHKVIPFDTAQYDV